MERNPELVWETETLIKITLRAPSQTEPEALAILKPKVTSTWNLQNMIRVVLISPSLWKFGRKRLFD